MIIEIGRTKEEQSRIDKMVDFMGEYVSEEIIIELFNDGFFVKPASITITGSMTGLCSITLSR